MSSSDEEVQFSVVIPTHNGRESVVRAVRSVLEQSHRLLEVVVVCDGDDARTRELLSPFNDPRLRIVEQPRTGVSAARNRGAAETTNPWLVFLDDDDCARPHWLEVLAAPASEPVGLVTARLALWQGDRPVEERDCRLSSDDRTMGASTILPGGFAVRRDVFDGVGGFDEGLTYSENQDLGLRLLHSHEAPAELLVVHVPEVVVDFHREPASTRVRRYRSAPADSARVFLDRYPERLAGDANTMASLLRIIARSERQEGRRLGSLSAALRAVRTQPTSWENYRSVATSLLPLRTLRPTGPRPTAEAN